MLNAGFRKTLDGKRSSAKAVAWRPDASRSYPWFLSRSPSASAGTWARMREIAERQGYDLSRLFEVPQVSP